MKALLKGTSCLLSVLLVFSLIIVAFSPLVARAETFSNVTEFPDFDMDCYVADLFTTEGHSLNNGIEFELNSESTNKIIKNSIESNSLLMGSMTAWQVATFEASDVTSDSVTEIGYYESIILSSINTAMKSSRVKDFFDNAVIKDGKTLFSSFKDILKSEYFITDFSLETYKTLSAEDQSAYIKSFGEALKKQYPKLDKTSDALKTFNTVVKTAKSFEECMNNYAAYSLCSLTNKHLTKVINDLYGQCPAEKVTLKAALLNISSACTSAELDLGADALDAVYRGADIIFGVLTDGWVTKIISAHPAGLALMLGRAIGKSVSNILFSTDAICENYYKMCCFDEFEQLVRSVTRYEMNTYTENKTNDNANNMFWAIRLMYNINEVGCDLSIDYAKTIYEKSVAGIFLDKTEYENYKNTIENIREAKQREYGSLMTSYIFYLEEDYPEIYAAYMKLIDEIENPVVHATGISFTKKHMTLGLADDTFYFWNNAEVSPSNASNRAVNYTSSNESVVSIKPGDTLMIELHQTGTVTITATSEDSGFSDFLTIDVVEGHGKDGIHLEDSVTNITESGKCGNDIYWSLFYNGLLKIYGSGMMEFKGDNSPWYSYKGSINNVIISSGVTSICNRAFLDCKELKTITIGNSVNSIGVNAFTGCKSLTSITVPNSTTIIGWGSFMGCKNLSNVFIGNTVANIDDFAFSECTSLERITIPQSVTKIGVKVFDGCKKLSVINVSDNNPYYSSLNGDLYNKDKTLLIQYAIGKDISFFVVPDSVTCIGRESFHYCTNLTQLTIPDSVTSIGQDAFSNCDNLKTINIPDSVIEIESYAFYECKSLLDIIIPDSVTRISNYLFDGCENLTNVVLPSNAMSIGKCSFRNCKKLTSIIIPEGVKSIDSETFCRCESLQSITIPSSVININESAFYLVPKELRIYGYQNSFSESYANKNRFIFVSIGKVYKDTGIVVITSDNMELSINETDSSDTIDNELKNKALVATKIIDIKPLHNGETEPLLKNARIKIPSANEKQKVYRLETNNTLTDMNAVYESGYLVFTTNQFDIFVIAEEKTHTIGDANLDGSITISDVTEIQKHLAELIHFSDEQLVLADTNGDEKIDINDATHLQKYLAEFEGIVLGKQPT